MNSIHAKTPLADLARPTLGAASLLLLLAPAHALAGIVGDRGSTFDITAKEGHVSMADGGSIYSWGYTTGGAMQLPGPTLIVTQGDTVTITLHNGLPPAAGNVSMVFPGLEVDATGGTAGSVTREAKLGGSVTYEFVATQPGTYQYHSGTRPDLQVEMGLYGALIVEPSAPAAACDALDQESAYDHDATCFDREYLFLLSEIDVDVHNAAEAQAGGTTEIDVGDGPFAPEYWLLNGRVGPDTMAAAGKSTLPTQPYNCVPQMHPGEKLLLRVVGAGRDSHPFHTHGNHVQVLAHDANLILTESGNNLAGPRLFTIPSTPGSTYDAVFEWTGEGLGWDIYGHDATDPLEDHEYAPDHGRPLPVDLPGASELTFGGFYSGSPFLGALGSLPPGEGGLNPDAGYGYMWHSHTERELVNNDVFPGGMMTMMIVVPSWVVIP